TIGGNDDEAGSSRPKRSRQYETVEEVLLPQVHHEFLEWEGCNRDAKSRMGCGEEIDGMLWINLFCHEFYSTYEFDEVCTDDELKTKKIIKFRLGGRARSFILLEFARRLGLYHAEQLDEEGFDVNPILRVLHKMITYGLCQRTIRGKELVYRESLICYGQFITKLARKAMVLSDEDLYERMGSMEIRQGAIEMMAYRQSYHWDRYAGVFEHMVGVYNVPLHGAYNPPGYAQPQYDQYYQQYPPQQQ
ncbi:hypothetical protein Tco_1057611, partial [Tanacetum coccineum]